LLDRDIKKVLSMIGAGYQTDWITMDKLTFANPRAVLPGPCRATKPLCRSLPRAIEMTPALAMLLSRRPCRWRVGQHGAMLPSRLSHRAAESA
jgi:hypothetical protein